MSLTKLYPKWNSYFLVHSQQTIYEKLSVLGKMFLECDKCILWLSSGFFFVNHILFQQIVLNQ